MTIARQSVYFGDKAQFGDGKPIVLIPDLSSHLPFLMLSDWLKALGYRPMTTSPFLSIDDRSVANLIRATTQRIGRKAVLVVPASGMRIAASIAGGQKDLVSDIIVLNASHDPDLQRGIRAHFVSSGWSPLLAMATLPRVLRDIRIELIEAGGSQ